MLALISYLLVEGLYGIELDYFEIGVSDFNALAVLPEVALNPEFYGLSVDPNVAQLENIPVAPNKILVPAAIAEEGQSGKDIF